MKYQIRQTKEFQKWLGSLRDIRFLKNLNNRLNRVKSGHFGDSKTLDNTLSELRFFIGNGYRVYFTVANKAVVLLVAGGTKDTQAKDISKARKILKQMEQTDD